MGLFAFRRLREREAASTEVASLPIAEPKLIPTEPDNGNHDNRHAKRGKRQLIPDAG
jgi:hypothetical protein